jgi:TOMM system kinase/cyclase fusion protein
MKKTSAALVLNGYQLLELLGEGGAGSVYKARQLSTGQLVALKVLRSDRVADRFLRKRLISRFERETLLCAQLHHPHIVRLLDQGQTSGQQLYAVFEFIPGITLKEYLMRHGPMQPAQAVEIMTQLLDALASAHAIGIVHRDLKPQNIMISQIGASLHIKVLDFGIATLIPDLQHPVLKLAGKTTREAIGTPSYCAPEQLRGEPATTRSDLYAFGLLLLECMTGKPVIEGATQAEILHKQLSPQEITLPGPLQHHPLGILLGRVLQKSSRERAVDAISLYAELRAMNLANIASDLRQESHMPDSPTSHAPQKTLEYFPGTLGFIYEQRSITVLCCNLAVAALAGHEPELEAIEALQRDQLNLCCDSCVRHGAFLAGSLGDSQMFYYGYPNALQDDALRAARTALDLMAQVRRRSRLLEQQQGVRLDISIAIHSGMVLIRPGHPPNGLTPDLTLRLSRMARPGTVLVSLDTRRLIETAFELPDSGLVLASGAGQAMPVALLAGELAGEPFGLPGEGAGPGPGRMVGQQAALQALGRAWHATRTGRGSTSLLLAEAGIGKSRLAREQAHWVRQQGFVTRLCRCLPEYRNDALYPFLHLLETHYHLQDAEDPWLAVGRLQTALRGCQCDLAQTMPILCNWFGLPLPEHFARSHATPSRQKQILLHTIQNLILHIGAGAPFLLILEDVHWIDKTSYDLLRHLIRQAPQHAMLLILTARPEYGMRWQRPHLHTIKLQRLSPGEIGQLLDQSVAPRQLAPATLGQLQERADGIPLFAEELLRMLREQHALHEHDGQLSLGNLTALNAIPHGLQAFLNERLSQLGQAHETAQLAAAIGREFTHELLLASSLSDEASVQSALDQMLATRLIARQRRVQGDHYLFRHALLRDAAYEAIPPSLRSHVHARIAWAMESLGPSQFERSVLQLAEHFALAGEWAKAIEYGQRARLSAEKRALHGEALHCADNIAKWQARLHADSHPAPDIYQVVTEALMLKYGWPEQPGLLHAGSAGNPGGKPRAPRASCFLLENLRSIEQATPLQWAMATYHHVASSRSSVRELTDQLLALSNQSNDRGRLKF